MGAEDMVEEGKGRKGGGEGDGRGQSRRKVERDGVVLFFSVDFRSQEILQLVQVECHY